MRRISGCVTTVFQCGLYFGLLLSVAGCAREDGTGAAAGLAESQAPAAELRPPEPAAAVAVPQGAAPPSLRSASQTAQDRERFRQALVRRFDASRMTTEPASPQGGVLHIPNGRAAHMMVAVKNADGSVTGRCISSAAEAEALMNSTAAGAGQ